MNEMPDSLLAVDEPAPVTVYNENGQSPFLIVADHAGNSCRARYVGLVFWKPRANATSRGTSASRQPAA